MRHRWHSARVPPPPEPNDPVQLLNELVTTIEGMEFDAQLNGGLTAKISAARLSLEQDRVQAACNQLGAFVNQVDGHPQIEQAQEDLLLGLIATIEELIGC